MRNVGRWAVEKQWSDVDLQEAKLSVFQSVDAPQAVSEEGMTRFLSGVSDEMLQERRERLLDVSKEQVREAAQRYIVDALEEEQGSLVFLGEKKPWVDGTWETRDMGISLQEAQITRGRGYEGGRSGLVMLNMYVYPCKIMYSTQAYAPRPLLLKSSRANQGRKMARGGPSDLRSCSSERAS